MDHPSLRPLRLSFGRVADTYNRVRPAYSQPLLDLAQEVLELPRSARVLDLAAGTGRLTHELCRRFAHVIAVEPDDDMRALITEGEVMAGSAEAIPLADSGVDAVYVGEAFHWFDHDAAIAELARVLRPRGGVALISTHWWETEPPLPDSALALLREPYDRSGRPGASTGEWAAAFVDSSFEPLQERRFEDEITVEADELLELYSTTSSLAAMSHSERVALLAEVRTHLSGPFVLPIRHRLAWTRLTQQ